MAITCYESSSCGCFWVLPRQVYGVPLPNLFDFAAAGAWGAVRLSY